MNVQELHSEELREEVARLIAESVRLREEAESTELQMQVIATRVAELEKEMVAQAVSYGVPETACVEWQPGS